MSRYIDAKALIDTFETKKAKAHEKSMKHLYGQNKNDKLYRKDCDIESRCEYVLSVLRTTPTVDAVPVDFINQKIVELQSCAYQHFDDGRELLATCVLETIRLLGGFLKEWRGKDGAEKR